MFTFINVLEKVKIKHRFFFSYSPERINVGDKKYNISNVKVVSGSNKRATLYISKIYNKIVNAGIHIVINKSCRSCQNN